MFIFLWYITLDDLNKLHEVCHCFFSDINNNLTNLISRLCTICECFEHQCLIIESDKPKSDVGHVEIERLDFIIVALCVKLIKSQLVIN